MCGYVRHACTRESGQPAAPFGQSLGEVPGSSPRLPPCSGDTPPASAHRRSGPHTSGACDIPLRGIAEHHGYRIPRLRRPEIETSRTAPSRFASSVEILLLEACPENSANCRVVPPPARTRRSRGAMRPTPPTRRLSAWRCLRVESSPPEKLGKRLLAENRQQP